MSRTIRTLALAALPAFAALALIAAPAAMPAKKSQKKSKGPIVGIADQKLDTFSNPLFTGLRVKRTRIVVPWDGALPGRDTGTLDALLGTIRANRVAPVVHLNKNCPGRNCRLPSVGAYARGFRALQRRYPWVKDWGVWNEANHGDQPTRSVKKGARQNARYYNAIRKRCKKCRIIAADVLDVGNMRRWMRTFRRFARGVKIYGLHNYRDVNTGRIRGTRQFFRLLKDRRGRVREEIWLTETGGIYFFKTAKGRIVYRRSEARQAKRTKFLFRMVRRKEFQNRITRLYLYHWRSDGVDDDRIRFDAGLLNADGTPRRAFFEVRKNRRMIR